MKRFLLFALSLILLPPGVLAQGTAGAGTASRFTQGSSLPGTCQGPQVFYDNANTTFYGCPGGTWTAFSTGGGGGSIPSGTTSQSLYYAASGTTVSPFSGLNVSSGLLTGLAVNSATHAGGAIINLGYVENSGQQNMLDFVDQTSGEIFRCAQSGSTFTGVYDPVVACGWNVASGGGPIDATKPAIWDQWEALYNIGTLVTERHMAEYPTANGVGQLRFFTSQFKADTGVDNFAEFNLNTGMQFFCLTAACASGTTATNYASISPAGIVGKFAIQAGGAMSENSSGNASAGLTLLTESGQFGGSTNPIVFHAGGVSGITAGTTTCSTSGQFEFPAAGADGFYCDGAHWQFVGQSALSGVGIVKSGTQSGTFPSVFMKGGGSQDGYEITSSYTDDADNCGLLQSPLGDGGATFYDIGYQRGTCTSLTTILMGGYTGVNLSLRGGANEGININTSGLPNFPLGLTLTGAVAITDTAANADLTETNSTIASVITTNASPTHTFCANYWTGAASAADCFTVGSSLVAGTNGISTLAIAGSGSTGQHVLKVPSAISTTNANTIGAGGSTSGINIGANANLPLMILSPSGANSTPWYVAGVQQGAIYNNNTSATVATFGFEGALAAGFVDFGLSVSAGTSPSATRTLPVVNFGFGGNWATTGTGPFTAFNFGQKNTEFGAIPSPWVTWAPTAGTNSLFNLMTPYFVVNQTGGTGNYCMICGTVVETALLAGSGTNWLYHNFTGTTGATDVFGVTSAGVLESGGTLGVTAGSFSSITAIQSKGGILTTLTGTSDSRLKTDIKPFTRGLKAILELHPALYHWNEEGQKITNFPANLEQAGFIAQDVQKAIPEAVGTESHDGVDYLNLSDRPIVAALVKAVQEQQEEIQRLEKKIAALEAK